MNMVDTLKGSLFFRSSARGLGHFKIYDCVSNDPSSVWRAPELGTMASVLSSASMNLWKSSAHTWVTKSAMQIRLTKAVAVILILPAT